MKAIITKLTAVLASVALLASCQPEPANIFPTDPVAPVVDSHNDILVTSSTLDEPFSFTWTKARFCDVASYEIYVVCGEQNFCLAKGLTATAYTITKGAFNELIRSNFALDDNVSVALEVYAAAVTKDGESYAGSSISLNVYSFGDAVPAVLSACSDSVSLNIDEPATKIDLVEWEAARFGYNVIPTYTVMIQIGDMVAYELASDITDNICTVTTDALNDAVVAAGGIEKEANEVNVSVIASAEGYPDVESSPIPVIVTTYAATFPEKVYLPGSHQGWNPATAPTINVSSVVKGQYEGFADLQVAGGGDCAFKFCVQPSWGDDFGIDNIVVTTETGDYVSVSGNGITGDNINVPSGVYWIVMSKKFKTLQMVQIRELDLIGDFCGWDTDREVVLSLDSDNRRFVADASFKIAEDQTKTGYKVRFNKQWEWSLGICKSAVGTEYFGLGGENAQLTLKAGCYSFSLDCNNNPVVPKFINMDMPETLVLAGDYSGHGWSGTDDVKIYLKDADNGIYKGYVTMMYTETPQTWGFKVVKNGGTWIGTSSDPSGLQHNLVEGGGENMKPASNHYYVQTDMINMTLNLTALTSVGIIGSFNGWGSDAAMTYDSASMTWSCDQTFAANDEFKFRFNGSWDYNLGTGGDGENGLIHEGGNITVAEAGTYHIVLDMHNTPSFTMIK